MYFRKSLIRALLLLAFPFFILSCFKVGEDSPKPPPPKVKLASGRCALQYSQYFSQFLAGKLQEDDIELFWDCTDRALGTFVELTKGKNANLYTPDELKTFLETYLLVKRRIPDSLVQDVMNLKMAVMGGAPDHVTREDIERARALLLQLKRHSLALNPYIRHLTLNIQSHSQGVPESKRAIAMLREKLKSASGELSQFLVKSRRTYDLKDFESLYDGFMGYIEYEPKSALFRGKSLARFAVALKNISVRSQTYKMSPHDWPVVLNTAADAYLIFLEYHYVLKHQHIWTGEGFQNLVQVLGESIGLLDKAVILNRGEIPAEAFQLFFEAMVTAELVPKRLTEKVLSQTLSRLLNGILQAPQMRLKGIQSRGLTRLHIENIKAEILGWVTIQRKIQDQYGQGLSGFKIPQALLLSKGSAEKDYAHEYERILKIRPLFQTRRLRAQVSGDSQLPQSFYNLSTYNWMRGILRAVFRGYAVDAERIRTLSYVTDTELQSLYLDFRDLGIALGFLDRRSNSVGIRASFEANLFTYQGNGDSNITLEEGTEFLSLLLSGGGLSSEVYRLSKDKCALIDRDRLHGFPLLSQNCVRDFVRSSSQQTLAHLKDWLIFAEAFSDEEWIAYFDNLKSFGSSTVQREDVLETSLLDTMFVILQYLEVVMSRFDQNRDGVLVKVELEKAYQDVFGRLFLRIVQQKMQDSWMPVSNETMAWGVYLYLLQNKELPSGFFDYMSVPLDLLQYREIPSSWNLKLDRSDLILIFNSVLRELSKAH